jgi:superfamily I DNA/RNA helicase
LRLRDSRGEQQPSVAYALASHEEQRMEQAERERLLYVALTRASDYLILAGPAARSSNAAWLSRLVTALGCPWEDGGPPPGDDGPLTVWRHIAENDRTATE